MTHILFVYGWEEFSFPINEKCIWMSNCSAARSLFTHWHCPDLLQWVKCGTLFKYSCVCVWREIYWCLWSCELYFIERLYFSLMKPHGSLCSYSVLILQMFTSSVNIIFFIPLVHQIYFTAVFVWLICRLQVCRCTGFQPACNNIHTKHQTNQIHSLLYISQQKNVSEAIVACVCIAWLLTLMDCYHMLLTDKKVSVFQRDSVCSWAFS